MSDTAFTVGIVVLSWNRRDRVLDCIQRLQRLDGASITVIVVDNASADDSVEQIARQHPAVVIVRHATNVGFVGGVNAGLREAVRLGLSHAWLVNDDTEVAVDVLPALLDFAARHPHFGILSPVIRNNDASRDLQFDNGIVDWRGSRLHDGLPNERFDELLQEGGTPVLIGTALLIDLRVIARIEGFEPAFFAYWEDIDFCTRAAAAGFASSVVRTATVLHDAPPRAMRPPHYFYYLLRNEALFWTRHARAGASGWRRAWLVKALNFLAENRQQGNVPNVEACADAIWDVLKRRTGQRDETHAAPHWFIRLVAGHPNLLVLLIEGRLGEIGRRLRQRTTAPS